MKKLMLIITIIFFAFNFNFVEAGKNPKKLKKKMTPLHKKYLKATREATQIASGVGMYLLEHGKAPKNLEILRDGFYLKKDCPLTDPWGKKYVFKIIEFKEKKYKREVKYERTFVGSGGSDKDFKGFDQIKDYSKYARYKLKGGEDIIVGNMAEDLILTFDFENYE